MTEETKRKISEARKGKGGRFGPLNPAYGKKYTDEEKKRISESTRKALSDPDIRRRMSESSKGMLHSEGTKRKMSLSMKGLKRSDIAKKNISMAAKKRNANPENNAMYGKKQTESAKIKIGLNSKKVAAKMWADPNHRTRMKQIHKKLWSDSRYRDMTIKRMAAGLHIVPNKQETKLMNVLNLMYPGEWKFVGDKQVIISGKSPDFINVNGQKKIIELFGDYWHKGEDPQDRADIFKPFGYETLVIWERELKNMDSVKNKIQSFHAKET